MLASELSDDFVTRPIDSIRDASHTLWIFQLRHDALEGRTISELLRRIESHRRAA